MTSPRQIAGYVRRSLPAREATSRRLEHYQNVRTRLLKDRGGAPTQAQKILADNAAALCVKLEDEVGAMLDGQQVNIPELNTTMNTLRRLLETLGIERVPRDITTLSEYLAKRQQQPAIINGSLAQQ
jgi:hypothetical protein